ncbi:acyltransferase [Williamsia sp. CHRR-6]|nr:acyltransferase [Williamsia sp. CHRR-6]
MYNFLITHIPFHAVRQNFLRLFGMKIGRETSIMMGTRVFGLRGITIGNNCSIGFNVLLDGRGRIRIDDDVVIASDVHIITGKHLVHSPDFGIELRPVTVGHHAWLASRSTILQGVTIGVGAVVAACSMVTTDVDEMAIVGGLPAKPLGVRKSTLEYHPFFRPLLY